SEEYVSLMKDLIERTRSLFAAGMPLASSVEGPLRIDLELFTRGGLAVLDAIEASGYDTLNHRPSISKWKQLGLLPRALAGRAASKNSGAREPWASREDVGLGAGSSAVVTTSPDSA